MPACYADILLRETSFLRCWYAMPASRQAALSKRAYMAEIFDPFSEEFMGQYQTLPMKRNPKGTFYLKKES